MNLVAEDVCFAYGSAQILDKISINISSGKVFGLLGPNGAGKSTLLRILNGQLAPRSGRVFLGEKQLADMSAKKIARHMAMVPQNPKVLFNFAVSEMVAMGRRPHQTLISALGDHDRQAVDQALESCGLIGLADRPVTELSGGETQLTFVARALAQEPDILLLDEATSNLDIRHTVTILSIIKRRASEDLTVISVVHDLNTAISFCDEIAFLSSARLIGPGPPCDLINADLLARVYRIEKSRIRVHREPFFVECDLS